MSWLFQHITYKAFLYMCVQAQSGVL